MNFLQWDRHNLQSVLKQEVVIHLMSYNLGHLIYQELTVGAAALSDEY